MVLPAGGARPLDREGPCGPFSGVRGRPGTGPSPADSRSPAPGIDELDRIAAHAMDGWLSITAVAVCVALLATWVPHYLLWPWFRDSDTFATMAQSWAAGILPYRDIRGYNFPGAIYLFWMLGQVAGWGRTWCSTPSMPPRWSSSE